MKIEEIKDLIREVSESQISDFSYEENGVRLSLTKASVTAEVRAVEEKIPAYHIENDGQTANEAEENVIKSPLVGTVYLAPGENEEPFVMVGDKVKKGQTLAIVEAMKLMNEIECEYDGIVKEVCVENQMVVEFGQKLFVIE